MDNLAANAALFRKLNKLVQYLLRFFLRIAMQIHISHNRIMTISQTHQIIFTLPVFTERSRRFFPAAAAHIKIIFLLQSRHFSRPRLDRRFITGLFIIVTRIFQRCNLTNRLAEIYILYLLFSLRFDFPLRSFLFRLFAQSLQRFLKVCRHGLSFTKN